MAKIFTKQLFSAIAMSSMVLLTGCASIVNGQNQPLSVKTASVKGAKCTLENNKGKWYVPSTPGSVTVHRSYSALHVTCEKKGHKSIEKNIESSTKAMAFGNVIFGGVVGAGVDVATGAAYDYPNQIDIPMKG